MTLADSPQAQAAERNRRAADRARAYRQRTKEAAIVDTAIAEALAASLSRVRRGCSIDSFIVDLAVEAKIRLKAAGIERPQTAFKRRILGEPAVSADRASEGH